MQPAGKTVTRAPAAPLDTMGSSASPLGPSRPNDREIPLPQPQHSRLGTAVRYVAKSPSSLRRFFDRSEEPHV